ncbi:bifunctional DNA-formamidopyrimidine glycosylase/DNA-(apurinic or apyrimidinic site) lyase [Mycoplasmopsis caviae]|uniref:DNA-formamidopyrimidine glycosylase n=1 Tax=Mycoplasmopsis caviae TaxID=55603 RepID=A0A3P8MD96_9BACT|nr:bifunctional DNA-formamidopyrimidine glycosylase/DNA-(apurinic or apyrimidinic site) lyase [Mycoplasmopsis caviae]UUD35704.1 bifunctional DNA-formamidopyrimidine glycosylase/DNA-(apurinic or apyrimidinic site) lyase [Mycoplasmopsis caviae]VDR41550.1 DNA-formamidopyrimidine glycosylase [Mycoplasmopsis caviae]
MPELPEVRSVVKDLRPKIIDRKIVKIDILEPKLIKEVSSSEFVQFLLNEKFINVENLAKHIIFVLSNNKYLLSHLRMSGKYFTHYKFRPASKHDYMIFHLDDGSCIYYNDSRKFGTFHIKDDKALLTTKPLNKVAKIPSEINVSELFDKIKTKNIPIKQVLMDQSLVSGIGNIYANETLFLAKVNPLTPAKNISFSVLSSIIKTATVIMDKATELGGSSIDSYTSVDGVKGEFQNFLQVHGHFNENCPRCKVSKINKIFINKRGTYYCPNCQK